MSRTSRVLARPSTLMSTRDPMTSYEENRAFKHMNMPGRVMMDLKEIMHRNEKLRFDNAPVGYSHQQIDALLHSFNTISHNIRFANVCSIPLPFIIMQGEDAKARSLVLAECHKIGTVMPDLKTGEKNGTFQGALVLEPECGLYSESPVTVLDYDSMYPSAMINENISHDTLVINQKYGNLPGITYGEIEADGKVHKFAKNQQGIIPRTLMKLLQARKNAKEMRDQAAPEFRPGLDGLQNAFKLAANSLCGLLGSGFSKLHLLELASCTTATGRDMLLKGKSFMETTYGAKVIYGDTDSIFCIFPGLETGDIERAIATAMDASMEFKKLHNRYDLEYDKTYHPFLLLAKKHYLGHKYVHNDDERAFDSKGVALNCRGVAPIVKNIYRGVADLILLGEYAESVAYLRRELAKLANNDSPLENLVFTGTLDGTNEKGTQGPLAGRKAKGGPLSALEGCGEEVPYIFISGDNRGNSKGTQCVPDEYTDYIREHGVKPDYEHYVSYHVKNPILQLFAFIAEKLTGYQHTEGYFQRKEVEIAAKLLADPRHARKSPKDIAKLVKKKVMEAREVCVQGLVF